MIEQAIINEISGLNLFKRVDGAIELAALDIEQTLSLPAAFVVPDSAAATDAAGGTQIFEQLVTTLSGVFIIVGADGARRGLAATSLADLEEAVIGHLAGLDLPETERPLSFVDARLVNLSGGRVSRLLRFRSIRRIRRIRPV